MTSRTTVPRESSGTLYSEPLALHVAQIYGEFCAHGEVITISAIARRAGASRVSVRAILRDAFGWTAAQSQAASQEGVRRGHVLLTVAGHPGLARGRKTLEAQGWPNLKRGLETLAATGHPGLRRGRATQAAKGWPTLRDEQRKRAAAGYPELVRGRHNLALRGWPNARRAHAVLAAQDYLPVHEGRWRTRHHGLEPPFDRRIQRGRSTALAVLEALETLQQQAHEQVVEWTQQNVARPVRKPRVTGRALASRLQLHPATVYAHLKQLRAWGIVTS